MAITNLLIKLYSLFLTTKYVRAILKLLYHITKRYIDIPVNIDREFSHVVDIFYDFIEELNDDIKIIYFFLSSEYFEYSTLLIFYIL